MVESRIENNDLTGGCRGFGSRSLIHPAPIVLRRSCGKSLYRYRKKGRDVVRRIYTRQRCSKRARPEASRTTGSSSNAPFVRDCNDARHVIPRPLFKSASLEDEPILCNVDVSPRFFPSVLSNISLSNFHRFLSYIVISYLYDRYLT